MMKVGQKVKTLIEGTERAAEIEDIIFRADGTAIVCLKVWKALKGKSGKTAIFTTALVLAKDCVPL